jgi:hypothetical protein
MQPTYGKSGKTLRHLDIAAAQKLYQQGSTMEVAARAIGTNSRTLRKRFKLHGIATRALAYIGGCLGGARRYGVNQNYFDVIDSEDKAYFLGFICADGCVYTGQHNYLLRIELNNRDVAILEKFKRCVSFSGKIYQHSRYNSCSIRLYSRHMIGALIARGVTQRKSLTLKFPSVPQALMHHFMRGYFDGDGCIKSTVKGRVTRSYQFEIMSTHSFCTDYQRQLIEHAELPITKLYPAGRQHTVAYSGNTNCRKIRDFLYKDATIFLKRKAIRFENIPAVGGIYA